MIQGLTKTTSFIIYAVDSGDNKPVAQSSQKQPVLQPSTDLLAAHNYQNGDVGFVPRAREHRCTRADTVRWLSASIKLSDSWSAHHPICCYRLHSHGLCPNTIVYKLSPASAPAVLGINIHVHYPLFCSMLIAA